MFMVRIGIFMDLAWKPSSEARVHDVLLTGEKPLQRLSKLTGETLSAAMVLIAGMP